MPYTKLENRTDLNMFIPHSLLHLTKTKKIKHNNINLKTDFIIHMINMCLCKYYFTKKESLDKELTFPLSSKILKDVYTVKYNHIMDYLLNGIDFISMEKNYYNGGSSGKCRTYKINWKYLINITRVKITDDTLIKKYKKEHLIKSTSKNAKSPVLEKIKVKVVQDLYNIELDNQNALNFLEDLNKDGYDNKKYYRNWITIKKLKAGEIHFKFDEYGRLHTNFTTLKKEIRKKFITIDGEDTHEIDIPNSQPLFLAILMKKTLRPNQLINDEFRTYFDLVDKGLLYEYIQKKLKMKSRDSVKDMMYKVLFGRNGEVVKQNRKFLSVFPEVFNFIISYKAKRNNHKSLSHDLQKMESEFIFNTVIKHIMVINPKIKLFTVHDSVVIPLKHKETVQNIFDYHKRKLLS